ncbi:MAG: S-layer homology domain-containing protein [Desulfotomaculaceae bacterium]|nr:S-layer homology domain-containing protein [Desulfotomaculaceae bacterium]MDD4768009.1 S-layer homology domain-containing protein [Desulfotomaculaceae bacterium]
MRRKCFAVALCLNFLLAVTAYLLTPSWAEAYQVISKTGGEEIITQGASLQTVRMKTDGGPLNVYILKADLSDPLLKIDTIIGSDGTLNKNQTVTDMARRTGAVAAINGDFFQMMDSGRTIGLAYQGGELVESPARRNDMYGFGLTMDKAPLIEVFDFAGMVTAANGKSFSLAGINKPGYLLQSSVSSDVDALNLYNTLWGTTSRGQLPDLTGVVEAVVQDGVVQRVLTDQPGVAIPANGYILQGHGQAAKFIKDNLQPGSDVSYTYTVEPGGINLFAAVGGQALLVQDGQLPAYFTQNISGKHARTTVGISKDGNTLYLVAVEKYTDSSDTTVSVGMTQEELADFLISIGVWRAVNLDGGGSTTLAARYLGDFDASLVNQPQGTAQRRVPDALGIFSLAPPGTPSGLIVSGPGVLLAGTSGKFEVKGYDQYHNPVRISAGSVSFSAPAGTGDFQGSEFTAAGASGTVTVTASLGNVSGTAAVRVIGPDMISKLVINPDVLKIEPGKSVQLSLQVKTHSGEIFDIRPADVIWSVDSSAGQIVDGKFTAGQNTVTGQITATFQGLTAAVPVTVQPPWEEIHVDPLKETSVSMDDWVEVRFPAGTTREPADIKLNHESNFSDVPAGIYVLGAVNLKPVEGQEVILNTPLLVDWLYSEDVLSHRPVIMLYDDKAKKWLEQPARIKGDGTTRTISARVWGFDRLVLADDRRPAPVFKDTAGHWANPAISKLAASGVLAGFPDGTFVPGQPVTRAQFAYALAAALQWPAPESPANFSDNVPAWARAAVEKAVSRGVIAGYPDGTYRPDAGITRSEMAVMIDRALALPASDSKLACLDLNKIPDFAFGAVSRTVDAGILQGSEGYFNPAKGVSRAEMAVALARVLNWWAEHP